MGELLLGTKKGAPWPLSQLPSRPIRIALTVTFFEFKRNSETMPRPPTMTDHTLPLHRVATVAQVLLSLMVLAVVLGFCLSGEWSG